MAKVSRARALVLPVVAAALITVSACAAGAGDAAPSGGGPSVSPVGAAPSGSTGPDTSHPGSLPASLTIDRSGGFAGVSQRVVIEPTGRWMLTGPGKTTSRTGRLSADQLAALRAATAKKWWAARSPATSPQNCPDGFVYVVTMGNHQAKADDCTLPKTPALGAVITLVNRATRS